MKQAKKDQYISTEQLTKLYKAQFNPNQQHDAQEFLRFFLGEIQEEQNKQKGKKKDIPNFTSAQEAWKYYQEWHSSITDQIFAGQFQSSVHCENCGTTSTTYDPFLDISVPVEDCTCIKDCLNKFFEEELIKDQFLCEKCKTVATVKKNMLISNAPQVFVIHLKRFKLQPKKIKLTNKIIFPLNFKPKRFLENQNTGCSYHLIALTLHRGSQDSGHYVTIAKRNTQWYLFDDETIRKITEKELLQKEAYLLFYQLLESK